MLLSQTPDGAIRRFVFFRTILLPAVGLAIAGAIGFAVFIPRYDPGWHKLAQPRELITGIVVYEHLSGRVFVMTASQTMYGCNEIGCTRFLPRLDTLESSDDCQLTHHPTPVPSKPVSLTLSNYPCWPVAAIEVHHVVLSDGTLWRWSKWTSDADRATTFTLAIGGCLFGFTAGLFGLGFATWLSARRIRAKQKPYLDRPTPQGENS